MCDRQSVIPPCSHTLNTNKVFIVFKGSDVVRTDVGYCSLGIKEHQEGACVCICVCQGVPLGKQMEPVGGFCREDLAGVASC